MKHDVLEELRAENPVPEVPPPPPFGPLLARLDELESLGTERDTALDRRPGRHRFTTWPPVRRLVAVTPRVASAALVAVAVVVAVGGILLLGHGRQARESSAASSQQELLLRTLGVLRTAPTATDRALATCIERSGQALPRCMRPVAPQVFAAEHPARDPIPFRNFFAGLRDPGFDLALIRSVAVAGSAEHVTIFPVSWRSSRPSAPRTSGVVVNLVDNNNNLEALDIGPTSLRALRAHGIAVLPDDDSPGRRTGLTVHPGAIIVPDGIAKVTVGMVISRWSASVSGPASSLRVLENVTAAVHDNVATVPLRTPTFDTGFGFGYGSTLRMTWLDAHGKVIKHTTTTFAIADSGPGRAM